jgi:hypothetical protein
MQRIATILLFAMVQATAGEAQELTAALSAYAPFGIDDLDGQLPLSAELRVTIPISGRFALEPFVTAGADRSGRGARAEGFYGLQIRQRIVDFTNAYLFATYGAAGYYSRYGYDGPIIGHFGLGLNRRISKHFAFRPEVHVVTFHVVPIGARFVVGLSVNAGR